MNKPLDLTIRKKTGISIHQQLVTQLAMQITSGQLPAGSKLPSVRQMSRKLGIHYNTCLTVYRKLEQDGLIEIKQGSGVKVAQVDTQNGVPMIEHFELNEMARYFIKEALKRGYAWEEIRHAANNIHDEIVKGKQTTLIWVDEHANILPVFEAELKQAFDCPLAGLTFDGVARLPEESDYCFVVSRYHVQELQRTLKKHFPNQQHQIIVVDVTGGRDEVEYVKQLPSGALMIIVSHSTIVLQQAEAVVAALRGHDLLLRTVLNSEGEDEIKKAIRHGQFVLADVLNAPIAKSITKKPVHTLKLIPEGELAKIREALSTEG